MRPAQLEANARVQEEMLLQRLDERMSWVEASLIKQVTLSNNRNARVADFCVPIRKFNDFERDTQKEQREINCRIDAVLSA